MWIKRSVLLILVLFLCLSAEGRNGKKNTENGKNKQNHSSGAVKNGKKKALPLTKKEKEALLKELSLAASSFNARMPSLTAAHIKKVMLDEVFDKLLNKKLPDDPRKVKKSSDTITYLGTRMVLFKYEILLKNPELPEVTSIPVTWYKMYAEKLKHFEVLSRKLDRVSSSGNMAAYQSVCNEIKAYQKVVADIAEGRKGKISADQMRQIRRKNMQWRQSQFRKNQEEILKKAGFSQQSIDEYFGKSSRKNSSSASGRRRSGRYR